MTKISFIDKFLIGFLPGEFQNSFGEKNNIKITYLTFISSIFMIFISLIFWFSFYGFYLKFKPGFFWIIFISFIFLLITLDSIIRIILKFFKINSGSLPFSLFGRYLKKLKKSQDFNDEILELKDSIIIHSPCPKPHWIQWGGISFNDRPFKISKHLRLEISHFFKFEEKDGNYPSYDKEREKYFNLSSDLSIILSPLWGFLPEKYQFSLLKYDRYNLRFYFYFSVFLTFFVSFPSLIFDLIRIMQKEDVLFFILPHFLTSLYFVYESLMRFISFLTERKIRGSLLSIFIKPLYYMIYGELL